jgi:cytochrome c peroxidase
MHRAFLPIGLLTIQPVRMRLLCFEGSDAVLNKMFRAVPLLLAATALASIAAAPSDSPTADELRWRLPPVPYPSGNEPTPARVELGERLFFETHLSKGGTMSCATCHNPSTGWSDGLPTARGLAGKVLPRGTPTIVNAGYAGILMWDGRAASLEDQALGPMDSPDEMAGNSDEVLRFLVADAGYRQSFALAYPGESIDRGTLAKAIASFERTVVSKESPFDRWLAGERDAMSPQQVRGFRIFTSPDKGNCATCHQAPHFIDDGFHNIGLPSYGNEHPDLGRYAIKPVAVNKGAFKTPGLRDVGATAPYFHDGSAASLAEVVEHYVDGGRVKTNLSANMKPIVLTAQEKEDLVAFLNALTSDRPVISPLRRAARTAVK